MKLETEIKNNFVGCYDEARGVALSKEKILRKDSNKCFSYMERVLLGFVIMFMAGYLLSFLVEAWWVICPVVIAIFVVDFIYLGKPLLKIYKGYAYRKNRNFKSSIVVDKNGITDESYYGVKMTFGLDKILGIVISKYTVTILTDTPIYFYFPISDKDTIINALKKYNKKIRIIE